MTDFLRCLWKGIGQIFTWLVLLPVFGFLFLFMIFGGVTATVSEGVDMLLMRESAPGEILAVAVKENGKTSRPQIRYRFSVNGQTIESERYLPGWFANGGGWSGGGDGAKLYQVGQRVQIHYRSSNPHHCCLEYGFFKGSLGFWLFAWGILATGFWREDRAKHSAAMVNCSVVFLGLLLAPNCLKPAEWPLYIMIWLAATMCAWIYGTLRATGMKNNRASLYRP